MIEVLPNEDGFNWTYISSGGIILAYSNEIYPTNIAAFNAGKAWRSFFWFHSDQIDHLKGEYL